MDSKWIVKVNLKTKSNHEHSINARMEQVHLWWLWRLRLETQLFLSPAGRERADMLTLFDSNVVREILQHLIYYYLIFLLKNEARQYAEYAKCSNMCHFSPFYVLMQTPYCAHMVWTKSKYAVLFWNKIKTCFKMFCRIAVLPSVLQMFTGQLTTQGCNHSIDWSSLKLTQGTFSVYNLYPPPAFKDIFTHRSRINNYGNYSWILQIQVGYTAS